jgi:hypothetical protein
MTVRLFLLPAVVFLVLTIAVSQSSWTPPRTPDGHPDLQGVWTSATLTPFERPAQFKDKPFLTKEEAAQWEATHARSDAPPAEGDPGTYNAIWFDSGTSVVKTMRTSLVIDPPDGKVPLTPEAEARRNFNLTHNADSWEYMSLWDRCITRGVPGGMFPAGYNNAYQIIQTPGYVTIFAEMIHDARVIPVDGRPHAPSSVRFWNGDSVGHWEGNTLVVDTTNFNGKSWAATSASAGRVRGVPQSADAHVVERFTREDANTITYQVTTEDPVYFAKPWTVSLPMTSDPNYRIFEYACHEGNQAVPNVLSGGRVLDQDGGSK